MNGLNRFLISGLIALTATSSFAKNDVGISLVPQPTACISSAFTSQGSEYWKNITLQLTNKCNQPIDFQDSTITFENKIPLNTNFWGNYSPLPYPDTNAYRITSQPYNANHLASLKLHFEVYEGINTILPANKSIQIMYGAASEGHISAANVYLNGGEVATGNIKLTNATAKPTDVSQTYSLIHIKSNGTTVSDVQLPWSGTRTVSGLQAGNYNISADNIFGSGGSNYQGAATPATVTVNANQTAQSTISYTVISQTGKLAIELQNLPTELAGYTSKPTVQITSGSSSQQSVVNWGTTSTITQLKDGNTYNFSTPGITFNNSICDPLFTPATLTASSSALPVTKLSYTCAPVPQSRVTLSVTGGPTSLNSLRALLTPNNSTTPVTKTISLVNGAGSDTVLLTTGTVYTVSADPVSNYSMSFNPQPFTASEGATETITLTPAQSGTPVALNGQLHVCGTQLCNEHNVPIQLKGMSSHGIQWYGWQGSTSGKACLTNASLDTLVTWGANVMRIAMYVQEGGYDTNPAAFTRQVNDLINEATKRGIYAIVDWHILSPGDPNLNLEKAKKFFTEIATAHKGNNNLLYEIANEPNGVSWNGIKTYAEQLIPVIRAIDNKTVILIGTPGWSSLGVSDGRSSQDIINSPVNFPNIMYTFHFYAASHKDNYYNEVDRASNVLPIFITEFGTQDYSGDGANDFAMSDKYLQLFARKKIGWTNWNFSDDFRSGAIWKSGTCSSGPWTDDRLKEAGVYIKSNIK